MTMTTTDERHDQLSEIEILVEACALGVEMTELFDRITMLGKRRRSLWLRASRDHFVTYKEIGEFCDLTTSVVEREIQRARTETRSPRLAAQLPRRRVQKKRR